MSLYDLSKREQRTDVFRLKNVEFVVTTAEQLAKARAKFADMQGSLQLKITWEPLTYKKFIGDERVTEEVDYIKMNKSDAVNDGNIELLREAGLRVVSKAMLVALPTNPAKADPDKQPQEYSRFMVAATKAGIELNPTEDGKVTSPQIGRIYRCRSGYEEFPTPNPELKTFWDWDDTRSTFMRVPIEEVKDFVQPADEDLTEFRYERKDESEGTAGVTTTSGGTTGDVGSALKALGIYGKPAAMLDANGLAILTSQVGAYPVLATLVPEVSASNLSTVLATRGLATVVDGTLVEANA